MDAADVRVVSSRAGCGGLVVRTGLPLVDVYLEFLGGRCRPNTVLAAAYDLKVFFEVVARPADQVQPADVLGFITAQRTGRGGGRMLQPAGAGLQQLIDNWTHTPAYAQATTGQVVAANRLAVALSPFFAVGSNTLRAAFLEPAMRQLYPDWEDMTAKAVSSLRAMLSLDAAEPGLLETIGELTVASERFATLWARRDVRAKTAGLTRFDHPVAGRLELNYEKLLQPEARQLLVVYHAAPGSPSAERLQLLASL